MPSMDKRVAYSEKELKQIQAAIVSPVVARKKVIEGDTTEEKKMRCEQEKIETDKLIEAFKNRPPAPNFLVPFWELATSNPELYEKIGEDPAAKAFSMFGFLPAIHKLIYEDGEKPTLDFKQMYDGRLAAIICSRKGAIIVKPEQSVNEKEIAQMADGLGIGPRQYQTLPGLITEEYVFGRLFSQLGPKGRVPEKMYLQGRRIGEILTKLHENDVFYNDDILDNGFGSSHVIIPQNSPAVLAGYGTAVKLDDGHKWRENEVHQFAITHPSMLKTPEGMRKGDLVSAYRPAVEKLTKDEIKAMDVKSLYRDLRYEKGELSREASGAFLKGFKETYSPGK